MNNALYYNFVTLKLLVKEKMFSQVMINLHVSKYSNIWNGLLWPSEKNIEHFLNTVAVK